MVYKCCVPSCKGNYKNTPKVAVFSFPKENNLREQWVRAIHRDNFQPTQYSKVCELHFPESSIQRVSEYYDTDTGKKLLVSLQKPHLKTGSVPVIFPSCPTYLSSSTPTVRESVNERNQRKENTNLEHAIKESIRLKAEYEKQHSFSTFSEFILCLKNVNISNEWTTIQKDNMIIFAVIDIVTAPTILLSAVINTDLKISLYVGKNELQRLQIQQFPKFINNINDVIDILDTFKTFGKTANIISLNDHLISVCDILKTVTQSLDEDKLTKRNFLCEQINLLNCRKNHVRYSSDFMILCSILFSISPHAYRFLRSTGSFTLPHPNTIHKICSKYNTSPSIEQDEANFLMYIKQKFSLLEDSDKIVTLMVDEIHLKAHLDYKGGNILGCAYNNVSAATSAQVFMIQSLLSSFKEVVHIHPVKTFNAEGLFTYIKQIIIGLHKIGFNVICVVTDNNSINRKAMSYFASPQQLRIVYNHPYNENQPLFYVLDSVHILKCIRNNWLNQKDLQKSLAYPTFDNFSDSTALPVASFYTLKQLYEIENSQIVKYAYRLNLKSLCPNSLERQNVNYVLNIFNEHTVQGLLEIGSKYDLNSYQTTADFITLMCKWWSIMNVKTNYKDIRFKNVLQKPLSSQNEENYKFLKEFLLWLDFWKSLPANKNRLTNETHLAISHTTYGLLELTKYCANELNFNYLLPGKIQTDALEARFGKYRTMAGSQYLVSVRQVYEVESKIRIQNLLPLTISSNRFGKIAVNTNDSEIEVAAVSDITFDDLDIEFDYSEEQFEAVRDQLPIFTYISGYCARTALRKLKCEICQKFLVQC